MNLFSGILSSYFPKMSVLREKKKNCYIRRKSSDLGPEYLHLKKKTHTQYTHKNILACIWLNYGHSTLSIPHF